MKATDLLKNQHRQVEELFERIEDAEEDEAGELVRELANALMAHMVIEQEIFYPALRAADEDMVLESYEEHAVARFALRRLLKVDQESDTFEARVTTLKELIEHHVEEEEKDLLPEAEDSLGDERLEELGARMESLFKETMKLGFENVLEAKKRRGIHAAVRGEAQEQPAPSRH
jgi:hemerythrin-like domain-containing protein